MKRILTGISIVVLFAAFLAGVIEYRARVEYGKASAALEKGDVDKAVKHFDRSLVWYVPFGTAERAAEELMKIGLDMKSRGKEKDARIVLSRMRSGLYGARSFYTPRMDLIRAVEPDIAELLAREKLGPDADETRIKEQADEYLALLQKPARPELAPAFAASGGFFLWVAAAFGFIFTFFKDDANSWKKAWPWTLVWGAGFIIWLWGMKWA